jgi:tryptophan 2,3-dioxygenase
MTSEVLTEREARYADTAFQTWDVDGIGELRGGTWGEVARAVIALADEEIEARVFDDFKHTLSAKDTIIAERDETIRRLQGCLDTYTAANTEALKAIEGYATERDEALAEVDRYRSESHARVKVKIRLQAERDEARATIERLTTEHKAAGIHAQVSTDARYAAEATTERIKALAYAWAPFKDDGHPHWVGCHLVHADCFVMAIRAVLEGKR